MKFPLVVVVVKVVDCSTLTPQVELQDRATISHLLVRGRLIMQPTLSRITIKRLLHQSKKHLKMMLLLLLLLLLFLSKLMCSLEPHLINLLLLFIPPQYI
jgi:hypothetical protein